MAHWVENEIKEINKGDIKSLTWLIERRARQLSFRFKVSTLVPSEAALKRRLSGSWRSLSVSGDGAVTGFEILALLILHTNGKDYALLCLALFKPFFP